jgi:hypothetical protein
MSNIDLPVWLLTFAGLFLGSWSIYWVRTEASAFRILCGRCVFLLALIELGVTAFIAGWTHSLSLAPMGLVSVFLVVAMLWESPAGIVGGE